MGTVQTTTDAYEAFSAMHGDYPVVRSRDELDALIQAADVRPEDVDARFWDLAFGTDGFAGRTSWAAGTTAWPTDAQWATFGAG